ncbi:ArsR family transcriptional regulator [Arsenicitalea aurantiaca]|uniref:ArsR family transcriptional regulator n=1 Tax=Arsenicitalea aurantiaca TaxID=1783274 RepID=A0A433XLR5_9HYPH|nr:metalloregulator ArsR/SmtB family transcription factor [Arsenicitalea aurantiaca]RUT35027.1 ArsR family transcriptional regulator [Arsenicitalea aurantiaca]
MSALQREKVFHALADGCRRQLLDRLRQSNGMSLVALCEGLSISRQAVTKHLCVLEEAGLVVSRKSGRTRVHYLNPVPIHAVALRWLREFDALPLGILTAAQFESAAEEERGGAVEAR